MPKSAAKFRSSRHLLSVLFRFSSEFSVLVCSINMSWSYTHQRQPHLVRCCCCIYGQIMRCLAALTTPSSSTQWVPAHLSALCVPKPKNPTERKGERQSVGASGGGRVMLAVICCWSISVLAFMCATKSCSLTQMLFLFPSPSLAVLQPGCSPN